MYIYIYIDIHVYTHTSRHEEYYPPPSRWHPQKCHWENSPNHTHIHIYMNIWGGAKTKCATPKKRLTMSACKTSAEHKKLKKQNINN